MALSVGMVNGRAVREILTKMYKQAMEEASLTISTFRQIAPGEVVVEGKFNLYSEGLHYFKLRLKDDGIVAAFKAIKIIDF